MIIDCHGHYTTTPPAVEAYRNAQKEILEKNPDHIFEKAISNYLMMKSERALKITS